jgi:hypothetical protein
LPLRFSYRWICRARQSYASLGACKVRLKSQLNFTIDLKVKRARCRNPFDAPEPGLNFDGYNFWLTKLDQFNGNFVSAEMVKAFLVSGEYRQKFAP